VEAKIQAANNSPSPRPGENPLLQVDDLRISFRKAKGRLLPVVDSANLLLNRNEAVGIVGESGSGKTMLCRALIGTLAHHGAVITSGKLAFDGLDLAHAPEHVWRRIRGREIGYIPQSSLAGLNPVLTIGIQLIESITAVRAMSHQEAEREAIELLERVRIPRATQVLRERPYQLSGGMRQRVMIATAIAQRPKLLVADEPTTALDVTVQREILTLITTLRKELDMALILVSHDLAVIEEVCDNVMVMYAGASVESGPVEVLATAPRHPYTRALRVSRVDMAIPGQDIETISGEPLSVGAWPAGCRFWPRCPLAQDDCRVGAQPALAAYARQLTACIHADLMDQP
jgi:oligopeptide/dipeptide ABC transporter ATP-binding protein